MLLSVFSVFDSKAQAYLQPFHAQNGAVASRMVADAVQAPDHMFSKHAADYTLFQIATFDDESGVYTSLPSYVTLGNLLTFQPQTGAPNV